MMAHQGKQALAGLAILAGLAGLAISPVAAAAGCAGYGADLAAMREAAEAVRAQVNLLAPPEDRLAARRIEQLDWIERRNALRLAQLLEQCGWPRRAEEGPQAAGAAWALAQPASTDLRFQKTLLRHLAPAVALGDAPARFLAITADRVALLEERPQPYGTQLRQVDACTWSYYPLDGRASVETRRQDAGLPPLDDYKRAINAMIVKENCPATPLLLQGEQ